MGVRAVSLPIAQMMFAARNVGGRDRRGLDACRLWQARIIPANRHSHPPRLRCLLACGSEITIPHTDHRDLEVKDMTLSPLSFDFLALRGDGILGHDFLSEVTFGYFNEHST